MLYLLYYESQTQLSATLFVDVTFRRMYWLQVQVTRSEVCSWQIRTSVVCM